MELNGNFSFLVLVSFQCLIWYNILLFPTNPQKAIIKLIYPLYILLHSPLYFTRVLLRYKLYPIQFTYLICTVQWILVNVQNCPTITSLILEHLYHLQKYFIPICSNIPSSFFCLYRFLFWQIFIQIESYHCCQRNGGREMSGKGEGEYIQ